MEKTSVTGGFLKVVKDIYFRLQKMTVSKSFLQLVSISLKKSGEECVAVTRRNKNGSYFH